MNTKYISSNVIKISVNSRVHSTSEISNISTHEMKYFLVFNEKRVNFLCIFLTGRTNGKQTASKLTSFPNYFSLILLGSARLLGIILVQTPRKWFMMSF